MGGAVLGLDYVAALSMAGALGYDLAGIAELLPAVEIGMVSGMTKTLDELNDR